MLERLVKLMQVRRALAESRFEEALRLLRDPILDGERRADDLKEKALARLLGRAAERRERQDYSTALSDVNVVLREDPEFPGGVELSRSVEHALSQARERKRTLSRLLEEAGTAIDAGKPGDAEPALRAAIGLGDATAAERLQARAQQRTSAAASLVATAQEDLARGDHPGATEKAERALALDREAIGARELLARAGREARSVAFERAAALVAAGKTSEAHALLVTEIAARPELEGLAEVAEIRRLHARQRAKEIRALMDGGEVERADVDLRALDPALRREAEVASLALAIEQYRRACVLRDEGDFAGAAACFESLAQRAGWRVAREAAKSARAEAQDAEAALERAREHVTSGRPDEARAELQSALRRWPRHRVAVEEQDALEADLGDRTRRLVSAREHLVAGRLLAARREVYPLLAGGQLSREAAGMLRDIEARREKVEQGIRLLRAAVTGPVESPGREAMATLLTRCDELATFQSDSPALARLRQEMSLEIEALARHEAIRSAVARLRWVEAVELLQEEAEAAGPFVRPERVEAEREALANAALDCSERLRANGAAAEALVLASRAEAIVPAGEQVLRSRLAEVVRKVEGDRARARELAGAGLEALKRADLGAARDALGAASGLDVSGPEVRRLREAIAAVESHGEGVRKVERMMDERDFGGAERLVRGMPPTPPVLRTRIFDLKRRLDQLEGLKGDFVLRVEEAGEYLALRGDRILVGNGRDPVSDLPILANIASRHLEVSRTMTFHGGGSVRIRALSDRSVLVNGRAVTTAALSDGDRIKLGEALELTFRLPSERSRTSLIRLERGFQVEGVDKVLLFDDCGKSGRILIGARKDSHVRVDQGEPEVELFAERSGELRCRYAGEGEVDGRAFSGESPVPPGSVVRCGAVVFIAQPFFRPERARRPDPK